MVIESIYVYDFIVYCHFIISSLQLFYLMHESTGKFLVASLLIKSSDMVSIFQQPDKLKKAVD